MVRYRLFGWPRCLANTPSSRFLQAEVPHRLMWKILLVQYIFLSSIIEQPQSHLHPFTHRADGFFTLGAFNTDVTAGVEFSPRQERTRTKEYEGKERRGKDSRPGQTPKQVCKEVGVNKPRYFIVAYGILIWFMKWLETLA
jgi:hypothetical protein